MSNTIKTSTCYYLFGQEAHTIFAHLKFSNIDDKSFFVDQCLELSMRVNIFILTHLDGFFLIDPMAFNNQCHLYALKVAQIKKGYDLQTEEEKLARTENNRFLHLAFFLSYALMQDTALFIQAVTTTLKKINTPIPLPRKKWIYFLRDEGKCREKAARYALNELFKEDLKKVLKNQQHDSPLHFELFHIASEKLQMMSSRGTGFLYTYPKFTGVVYMVDQLAKDNIPFVLKIKVITKKGMAGNIIQANTIADGKTPVLIFEGIATDGSYSIAYCREEAKRCPHYFYRYQEKNKRHDENNTCFFCKKTTVDLTFFLQRIQQAMRSTADMFYALGADFVLHLQPDFKPFFADQSHYPHLTQLFQQTVPNIKALGLEMDHPTTFSICHVHTDSAQHAFHSALLLDMPAEDVLRERGIL